MSLVYIYLFKCGVEMLNSAFLLRSAALDDSSFLVIYGETVKYEVRAHVI